MVHRSAGEILSESFWLSLFAGGVGSNLQRQRFYARSFLRTGLLTAGDASYTDDPREGIWFSSWRHLHTTANRARTAAPGRWLPASTMLVASTCYSRTPFGMVFRCAPARAPVDPTC